MANKITIEFIDDIESANMALNAQSYYSALLQINQYLRMIEKHEELSDDTYNKVVEIQDMINEITRSSGIEI